MVLDFLSLYTYYSIMYLNSQIVNLQNVTNMGENGRRVRKQRERWESLYMQKYYGKIIKITHTHIYVSKDKEAGKETKVMISFS